MSASTMCPAWLQEFETALLTNPHIVLYGNIRDHYLVSRHGEQGKAPLIIPVLTEALRSRGFEHILVVDPVSGVSFIDGDQEKSPRPPGCALGEPLSLEKLAGVITWVSDGHVTDPATNTSQPTAVIVDYAARLVRAMPNLDANEHQFFVRMLKLSQTAMRRRFPDRQFRYQNIIWLLDTERDLPDWFIARNESVRRISIPRPGMDERTSFAALMSQPLSGPDDPEKVPEEDGSSVALAEATQGLSLRAMKDIIGLATSPDSQVGSVTDAARFYRVGITDDPWARPSLRRRLEDADRLLAGRVIGQQQAIAHSVDILVRSVMGFSGAHAAPGSARPRGILFFAGPTGVGKTELAKALTERIFGDEKAYIRFDMSEFSAEHAADRLIGAPPGYVGHDAGGELTNAVREQPFSLLLFDEIEKAHGRILDKFLQILDDGRLTDATGATVYFSETVIVFTTNLGMQVLDEQGIPHPTVSPDTPREDLVSTLTAAIRDHFTHQLNRPELLNRIGDNIVIFNFITREHAAQILDLQIARILEAVNTRGPDRVRLSEDARQTLLEEAHGRLAFGGRGVGSVLETTLINPLARALFRRSPDDHERADLTITAIRRDTDGWVVELADAASTTG